MERFARFARRQCRSFDLGADLVHDVEIDGTGHSPWKSSKPYPSSHPDVVFEVLMRFHLCEE